MRKVIFLIALGMLALPLSACGVSGAAPTALPTATPNPTTPTSFATIGFSVSGWTWGGCIAVTVASVRQLAGIKQVTSDLEKGTLVVEYDPQAVTPDQIAQQIEKVGYRVEGRFKP